MSIDDRLEDAAHAVNELWAESDATHYRLTRLQARLTEEERPDPRPTPADRGAESGLLLISDDDHLAAALTAVLARHAIAVTHARGEEALQALAPGNDAFAAVFLDLSLPDEDGYELCGQIRRRTGAPLLMATHRADVRSRVRALQHGIDDYLIKPYDTGELITRILALTGLHPVSRHTAHETSAPRAGAPLRFGPVLIDPSTRQASVDGSVLHLTRKEFDLLALLAQRPGTVVPREQIISELWPTDWQGSERPLEALIASLRAKLRMPTLIETVRGVGYRLVT